MGKVENKDSFTRALTRSLTRGVTTPHGGVRVVQVELPVVRVVHVRVRGVRGYGVGGKRADDAVLRSGPRMPEMMEARSRRR